MRIGTWNLAGRWTPEHERFVVDLDCDVLLLTEVSERVSIPGYGLHLGAALMARRRRWAGVASRLAISPLPDPHPASAMAVVDGWTFCSAILPWKGAGSRNIWAGSGHAAWTESCLSWLLPALPTERLIWGGDWNHALSGREWTGSVGGRTALLAALEKLNLHVPTASLAHRIEGLLSIDHIAIPTDMTVTAASRVIGSADGRRLSDHDAYVVDLR
ncbi:hypothetical protein [Nocardioides sp.]|uniref:hypothetical protein n=1 Tax=Nocardioides sp. TaxID=35761 RepID=UPI002ED79974